MSKVLAKVNGREITQSDLDAFFQTLGPQVQAQFQGEEGMKRLLDELVFQELFYVEAIEEKVAETEDFLAELEQVKENLLKQYGIRKLIESINVSDEEAKAFYEANPQYFQGQEQVSASHILVDEAEEAQKIYEELKAGLDFAEAAQKYSSCPSKEKGGDLGYFQKGQMVPEFEAAAFGLGENEMSEPVQTQFGYHIILKTGEKPAEVQDYAMVANQIVQQLTVQKQNDAYMGKVDELKGKYSVEMM